MAMFTNRSPVGWGGMAGRSQTLRFRATVFAEGGISTHHESERVCSGKTRREQPREGIMFGSQALEVAIGMALIFFIVATASSAVVDLISSLLKKRSKDLRKTVYRLLSGEKTVPNQSGSQDATSEFMKQLLESSPVAGLAAAAKDYPSYIPAKNFAEGVLSIVSSKFDGDSKKMDDVLDSLPDNLGNHLREVAGRVGSDIVAIQAGIEDWFDSAMDRASGGFKRWSRWVLIVVATVIIVAFNVDAVDIGTTLWTSEEVRVEVAGNAPDIVEDSVDGEATPTASAAIEQVSTVLAPFGWKQTLCPDENTQCDVGDYAANFGSAAWGHLLGWFITVMLVSLGAPFWYGALSKLVALRDTGAKPGKAGEEPGSAQSTLDKDPNRTAPKRVSEPVASLAEALTPANG
jgi:hypothetical protein